MSKPSSIYPLYMAIAKGEASGFTVPAINIRTLTYDFARLIFKIMTRKNVGAVIFEISPTEMEYTGQSASEYASSVLKAATDGCYRGPVFLQGDHFQINKNKFAAGKDLEIERIKNLIKKAFDAGFLNIDIDASTLVNLSESDLSIAQKENYEVTSQLASYIRKIQEDETISIGAEIGHIGDRASTIEDLEAFMRGFSSKIPETGLSKISVASGTTHGGKILPSGKLEEARIDFEVLASLSKIAREKYGLAGIVAHGASTLPREFFPRFRNSGVLEVHLSTAFQNIVYDNMRDSLREEMYDWLKENLKNKWRKGWSQAQFIYKTRKYALGQFKQRLNELSDENKKPILESFEKEIEFLFKTLGVFNTEEIVRNSIQKK